MRSITLATLLAVALVAPATAAENCFTGSIFDGPFADGERCYPAVSLSPTTGGPSFFLAPAAPVAPVDPIAPVDPVEPPTEVPSTPLTPAKPNPGVYSGSLVGTPYEGTPAGPVSGFVLGSDFTLPNGSTIPAGTYSGQIAPNGMFVVRRD